MIAASPGRCAVVVWLGALAASVVGRTFRAGGTIVDRSGHPCATSPQIYGAQGTTADTCHGLLTGHESRQQLYTMLSRGRHANHAYLQITGDDDPHNRLSPGSLAPATPTKQLEAVLARSDVAASATTQLSELRDPRTLLAAAVACYHDAIVTAAEQLAGADLIALLDHRADTLGLTDADAWPVARSHLLILNAQGVSPISALQYAVNTDELNDAHDPAAVVDRRLDVVSLRAENDERRPLPWLPAVPDKLLAQPEWRRYLAARWALVTDLAERVHQDTAAHQRVPRWAASLVEPPTANTLAQIEVWRAAHQIPDTDLRPTGPAQHHLVEARSQHRLDSLISGESEAVLAWLNRIHQAAPGTIEDPATIRLARECAAVDPKSRGLPKHLAAAAREPLPDDHKSRRTAIPARALARRGLGDRLAATTRPHRPPPPRADTPESSPKPRHRHLTPTARHRNHPGTTEGRNQDGHPAHPTRRTRMGLPARSRPHLCGQHLHPAPTDRDRPPARGEARLQTHPRPRRRLEQTVPSHPDGPSRGPLSALVTCGGPVISPRPC